jgi:hypothetical protein
VGSSRCTAGLWLIESTRDRESPAIPRIAVRRDELLGRREAERGSDESLALGQASQRIGGTFRSGTDTLSRFLCRVSTAVPIPIYMKRFAFCRANHFPVPVRAPAGGTDELTCVFVADAIVLAHERII